MIAVNIEKDLHFACTRRQRFPSCSVSEEVCFCLFCFVLQINCLWVHTIYFLKEEQRLCRVFGTDTQRHIFLHYSSTRHMAEMLGVLDMPAIHLTTYGSRFTAVMLAAGRIYNFCIRLFHFTMIL